MRIAVVDGRGLACRLYYGNPHGSLVEGFVRAMNHVYELVQPDRWCVAWESGPSFRADLSPDYKGTRGHKPTALSDGLGLVEKRMKELGVGWVQVDGYEADDVMESVAAQAIVEDDTVALVTDDKDMLQCVEHENVKVLKPAGWRFVGAFEVVAEWGVRPYQIPDVLALMGDTSDNVSGVPGIGKKTACSLVARWGSLQGILDNIDQVPGRAGTLIESYSEQAKKSLALVSLKNDACGLEVLTEATTLSGRNT